MAKSSCWLVIGTEQNWHTAFDYGPIWGLRNSQRHYWEKLTENSDIVFFYVTAPVSGVVGYGVVRTKLLQNSPLWPDERARNELIWPLRFEFDVLSCLPPAIWRTERYISASLKTRARSGFQSLEIGIAEEIMKSLPSTIPGGLILSDPVGPRGRMKAPFADFPSPRPTDAHDRTQVMLSEIGRMQSFQTQMEFSHDDRRFDVVWRRIQRSVPSYVFEVQIGGNLTEAMGKLKQAFDLWNSNVFLVGKEEHREPTSRLAGGMFREIQQRVRFVEVSQVEELYQRKRAYREMETNLGLLP